MTLDQITELIEECKRLDSALVIDPDVVAALVRVALAAKAHVDWEYRRLGAPRFTLTDLRAALADLDR